MKKVLNLVVRHVEKIVLALLMVTLILVILWQLGRINSTKEDIKKTTTIDLGGGRKKKPIEKVDVSQFDLKVPVQVVWRPAYTAGPWKKYAEAGDPRIFRRYKRPPMPPLTEAYRDYLEEYGPGSLFDPQLYVHPRDGKPFLLGFESVRTFYSPFNLDFKEVKPGEENNKPDEVVEPGKLPPLAKWIRVVRIHTQKLPFMLNSVVAPDLTNVQSWTFTFRVRMKNNRVRYPSVKVNDRIEGTEYVVTGGTHQRIMEKKGGVEVPKDVYQVTVKHRKEQDITLTLLRGRVENDPSVPPAYELDYFPRHRHTLRKQDGDKIKLSWKDTEEEYELTVEDGRPELTKLKDGKAEGKPIVIPRYHGKDYEAWEKEYKPKAEEKK